MTTALICAMPMELKPLVKKLGLTRRGTAVKQPIFVGTLNGEPVVAVNTGMGPDYARDTTAALFDQVEGIKRVVVFGITGAVDDDTEIGQLIVPATVINSLTGAEYTPDPAGATARGLMWTTNVITPPHEMAALIERGVVALDMETAVIGELCASRGIPWSVRRAVSDNPADGITDEVFKLANMDGSPNPKRVAKFFLTKPYKIPAMMRLAKGGRIATINAAKAAIEAAKA